MTEQAAGVSVTKAITVEAPIEHAFSVFTEGFDSWWPRGHHIGEADLAEAVMEAREGGRFYEKSVDGSECEWGRVLAWDPPNRVVLAWQLTAEWQYDPDFLTEVEVRFTADGPGRTQVELEHRNLERYGEDMEKVRAAVGSDDGWGGLLRTYARWRRGRAG
jgi:uncharacterized protein YndB with AHSA1/START domain